MKNTIQRLVFTVFLLWITVQIDSVYENYIAYFLIFTVGILHGSNDISLINHLSRSSGLSSWKLLLFYISIILSMSVLFYFFPFLALLIFIGFSCFHFGEQHWYEKLLNRKGLHYFFYFFYGAFILGLIFYLNTENTTQVIFELTKVDIPDIYFTFFLMTSLVGSLVIFWIIKQDIETEVNFLEEFFLLILFFIVFKLAALIWAFAIYFIIWHSIPSLEDQVRTLYGQITRKNLIKYFQSSLLNWLISLGGLVGLYYASMYVELQFITLFFAFLAAITIPHVIVMYYLNKK